MRKEEGQCNNDPTSVSLSFLILLPNMGLDNPCCVGTPSNLPPMCQYSLDRLVVSIRSLLNKGRGKGDELTELSLQHLMVERGEKYMSCRHTALGSHPGCYCQLPGFGPQVPPWILRLQRYWSPRLWARHGQLLSASIWKSPRMPC